MELNGVVAVVTGASSGIGEATALALARRGSNVVVAARRQDRLDELARRVEMYGATALAVRCDVTERDDLANLARLV